MNFCKFHHGMEKTDKRKPLTALHVGARANSVAPECRRRSSFELSAENESGENSLQKCHSESDYMRRDKLVKCMGSCWSGTFMSMARTEPSVNWKTVGNICLQRNLL